jgi:2-dehydro-3-deoxygluconokinase
MSRVVCFGEIMGRLATPGFKRFQQAMPGSLGVTFAGAEASIASSIAYLGGNASFVTALPNHAIADACVANLRSLGLDTKDIVRTPLGRLGLYYLETGANQRPGQIIYDREGSSIAITPAEAYDWERIFEAAEWFVISGITPAISRNAAEVTATALDEARKRNLKIAIDMNYRSKLWQWEPPLTPRELATRTMRTLIPYADLFVGGREDAEAMLDLQGSASNEELARQITSKFPNIRLVAMTLRESISATHNHFGGMLYDATADQAFYAPEKGRLYSIANVVDRIGTGDAFTAGLLFSLLTHPISTPAIAIAFASAAGCLAHSIEGDCNFSTRTEIEALMHGNASGRVIR